MENQLLVLYLASVVFLGIFAQWLAWRVRLPSILLLLTFGIALGYLLDPDQLIADLTGADVTAGPRLLFPVVSLSVAIILFEGGLTLRISELREAGRGVLRLVTLGAVVTWLLAAVAAWRLLGLSPEHALLLGAVLVVTGPTVVGPLLLQIRPKGRVGSIAKWEGIVIDPVGAVLAVLVFEVVVITGERHATWTAGLLMLAKTLLVGGIFGAVATVGLVQALKRFWIPDYLHGVVVLAAAIVSFTASNALQHESGLVTVTILGILLANQKSVPIGHVVEFKEHLRVLLISCLFIVLGSRIDLRLMYDLGWGGVAFVAVLILCIRPLAVFSSLLLSDVKLTERVFLSWLAPRGIVAAAVSSVFALELASVSPEAAIQGERIVSVTFLVIVSTVAVYGLSAGPLARWLRLADSNPQGILFAGAMPWCRDMALALKGAGFRVLLVDTNYSHVAETQMADLPAVCASILSEHVHEELDLSGIGRILALTANDEVNTLAAREFIHVFGRQNAYQLPPADIGSGHRQSVSGHLHGRLLFDDALNYDAMTQRIADGFVIKRTQLSDEYGIEDFLALYGEAATILFLIDENRQLIINAIDAKIDPQPGHTLIALVPPVAANSSSKNLRE